METVSLQKIIDMVLEEAPNASVVDTLDNDKRNLYRQFNRLIEKLSASKVAVKKGGRNYEFSITEVTFVKVLLSQMYSNQGVIAEFLKKNGDFSSKDVCDLITSLLDEAKKDGATEEELMAMEEFYINFFYLLPMHSIEQCYNHISMIVLNLQDMTSSQQAVYLNRVEHLLKKEAALIVAESLIRCTEIAEILQMESASDVADYYHTLPHEVEYEYFQRDRAVLARIQEDDDLRKYIENKLGEKAEEIFGHVL